jgi:hypothetical protein
MAIERPMIRLNDTAPEFVNRVVIDPRARPKES